jgi:L-alanine-DL-glutamate epimerase-like enolase superfamily enzyme
VGLSGIGFTYTVGVGGSAIKALLDDYVNALLVDRDVLEIEATWQLLFRHLHRTGSGGINTMALAAVDIALWDLRGKREKLPLYKLLGAARDRIPVYASGIDFHLELDELLSLVESYLQQGFRAVKIKVGKETLENDRERAGAVRRLIGSERFLLLDANQKWMASDALQRIRALEEFKPTWIEEPISSFDILGHARIRAGCQVPIAVGESLYNKYEFVNYIRAGALDVVQADVARVGGVTEWVKIAHVAQAHHLPVAPHFLVELSVQLLCGVSNGMILENVHGGSLCELGLVETPLDMKNGYAFPSELPGHGIVFSREALEKFRITPEDLRQLNLRTHKN